MPFSTTKVLLGLLATTASAFPSALLEEAMKSPEMAARAAEIASTHDKRQVTADPTSNIFEPIPIFNAAAQYVDVGPGSGHEWEAPGPNDLRGPCPGLNAFANHKFLPKNGYATITQFIEATTKVAGMSLDLAGFLALYGAVIDGSGLGWSIAGTPPASLKYPLGGGNGLSGSHNKYENDGSPTRPDLYSAGNNYQLVLDQYQDLVNTSPGGVVTMDSLTTFRSKRWDQQVSRNPYFFSGPLSGLAFAPAGYTFIYRFMANHSAEHPKGELTHDVLATWFAVSGEAGSYTVNQGHEAIPRNWYKRAVEYPYSIPYFTADVLEMGLRHPKFLSVGGNTGTTNSFSGVNVGDLTGGVFNSASLLEKNNLGCFILQVASQAKPDLLAVSLTQLTSLLGDLVSKLGCPQLGKIDDSLLKQFPGYTKSYGGYKGQQ